MARWTNLLSVAMLCLIGQMAVAEHCFDVDTAKEISFDDLMTYHLGQWIFNFNGISRIELSPRGVGLKVATWLARTIGKREARDRLHGFSVNGLLKLDKFGPADCATTKLQERAKTCEIFSTEKEGKESIPSDLPTKEDYVRRNLGAYCWSIRVKVVDWCTERRVDKVGKQMSSSHQWALDAIGFKVNRPGERNMPYPDGRIASHIHDTLLEPINSAKAFFVGEIKEPSESKLIEACDKLREKFGPLVEEKIYLKKWQKYWNYCKYHVKQTKES